MSLSAPAGDLPNKVIVSGAMLADENKEKTWRRRGRNSSHAQDTDLDSIIADALSKQEKLSRELLEIQHKAFQACFQMFVETVNKRVDTVIFEHGNAT